METNLKEKMETAWYENLGRIIADEFNLSIRENSIIEHQLGTVWAYDCNGKLIAINGMITEKLD